MPFKTASNMAVDSVLSLSNRLGASAWLSSAQGLNFD
jgi:hypothetical protein